MSDHQRAAVYSAEAVAFSGTDLEDVIAVGDVLDRVRDVVEGSWWPGPPVAVRAARSDAASSSARCAEGAGSTDDRSGLVVIRIAAGQATLATAAHELAHALAGPACGHDPTFRVAYLDTVAAITNPAGRVGRGGIHVEQLRSAFVADGLSIGERRWPAPDVGRAIPL